MLNYGHVYFDSVVTEEMFLSIRHPPSNSELGLLPHRRTDQARSQKFVLGRYKTSILVFNYRFDVIFIPQKVYLD